MGPNSSFMEGCLCFMYWIIKLCALPNTNCDGGVPYGPNRIHIIRKLSNWKNIAHESLLFSFYEKEVHCLSVACANFSIFLPCMGSWLSGLFFKIKVLNAEDQQLSLKVVSLLCIEMTYYALVIIS